MDVEFHYYMTYLIAKKAKIPNSDALLIAKSCQYVDDNYYEFKVKDKNGEIYENYISQTMNITKPKQTLSRIYPAFHFLPGDIDCSMCQRKDYMANWFNTTPHSKNSIEMVKEALKKNDLYRIGISLHTYADTWAHQNFCGIFNDYNAIPGIVENLIPNIGHADAKHAPDIPALVWRDKRLLNERVDNRARFMEAAKYMLEFLVGLNGSVTESALSTMKEELCNDLLIAIGSSDDPENTCSKERIEKYRNLSSRQEYGGDIIPEYDDEEWEREATTIEYSRLTEEALGSLGWDDWRDPQEWKVDDYKETNWYKFQEAVKEHQRFVLALLADNSKQGFTLWQEGNASVGRWW